MRRHLGPILAGATVLVLAGCSSDDRQWLKLNEKYTTDEFRRDHTACSKSGKLDEACMRARGWVAVNPGGKPEARDPRADVLGPPSQQRTRY
jgi:uncharacterized lipoprotein